MPTTDKVINTIFKKGKKMIKINNNIISHDSHVYFIADIAANHDGDIERAKDLILLAKKAGADAVKFQHHDVNKYVSGFGVKKLVDIGKIEDSEPPYGMYT